MNSISGYIDEHDWNNTVYQHVNTGTELITIYLKQLQLLQVTIFPTITAAASCSVRYVLQLDSAQFETLHMLQLYTDLAQLKTRMLTIWDCFQYAISQSQRAAQLRAVTVLTLYCSLRNLDKTGLDMLFQQQRANI